MVCTIHKKGRIGDGLLLFAHIIAILQLHNVLLAIHHLLPA